VKARRVKGLDPDRSLRENAARVVEVRLKELVSFDPAIRDPQAVRELHDMRIAAKRLRYVLEIAGFAFGPEGQRAEAVVKELQEVLGEIHDCDVMLPLVEAHVARLRAEDARVVAAETRDPAAVAAGLRRAPNRAKYRGLELLAAGTMARRALLYERFLDSWDRLAERGWRDRLLASLRTP
jgi:hypothetical protein